MIVSMFKAESGIRAGCEGGHILAIEPSAITYERGPRLRASGLVTSPGKDSLGTLGIRLGKGSNVEVTIPRTWEVSWLPADTPHELGNISGASCILIF